MTDEFIFRLTEEGPVSITEFVHVYDIFAEGPKYRCHRLFAHSNRMVPVNNLGELKCYGQCHLSGK